MAAFGIVMRPATSSPQTPTVGAGSSQREDSPARLPHHARIPSVPPLRPHPPPLILPSLPRRLILFCCDAIPSYRQPVAKRGLPCASACTFTPV